MPHAFTTDIQRIATDGPDDTRGLQRLIDNGTIDPARIVAIFGKTEGNGCVNDFTRGYATQSLRQLLAGHIGADAAADIAMVMSGGTEGVLSPHITVVTRVAAPEAEIGAEKALTVGIARTPVIAPADIGRRAQIDAVATAVDTARQQAGIDHAADVHYVQIKCPLLTSQKIQAALADGQTPATTDTYKSMGYSRGASALGVAVALGEIDTATLTDDSVLTDMTQFSDVASASAGSELDYCEVIVLGNSTAAAGDLYATHAVMQDAIDADAIRTALGGGTDDGTAGDTLVQVFAKAEAAPNGTVRGRRHTMINDSDINHTRHARAVVGGVIAALTGDPMIYVSGGAEHQGPAGGGVVAAIRTRR